MKRIKRDKVRGRVESTTAATGAPTRAAMGVSEAPSLFDRLLCRPMVNLDTPEVLLVVHKDSVRHLGDLLKQIGDAGYERLL